MEWTSFLVGLFFGVMVGIMLLACLQFVRERREDGIDFVDEIEALRFATDGPDEVYIRKLRAENRQMVERIIGKEDA